MTPTLILAIARGLWLRTAGLMPFNPYPYAITVVAADRTVLAGVFTFIWKRRSRAIPFPAPTRIARITYSVQMPTLVVGVLGVGPDMLLAALMYLTIIFTLVASYSYFKRGATFSLAEPPVPWLPLQTDIKHSDPDILVFR